MSNTKHKPDCVMAFGRKDETCPRCQELLNGAKPRAGWSSKRRQEEADRLQAIRNHNFAACTANNVVCTHFDW